jgi:hypothetical protein
MNGDKSSTDYANDARILEGTSEEHSSCASNATKYGTSEIEDNLSDDVSVVSSVKHAVCKKYG